MQEALEWNNAEEAWEKGLDLSEQGDMAGAAKAYEYAAKRGHALAQLNLGNILDDELSPPDPTGAVYWYERAVEGGVDSAAWNLFLHYLRVGDDVLREQWLRTAAAMEHPDALKVLQGKW
jgi:TPR repeat protein